MSGPIPLPLLHSFLFVPGNRPERFAKALAASADAIIVDLEDAVAAEQKAAAREAVRQATFAETAGPLVYLRINAVDTPWFADDLALLRHPGIHGVMLPKVEHAAQIQRLDAGVGKVLRVIPIIESAAGLYNAAEIARAAGVERLAFGSIDYQLDMNCEGTETALLHARSQLAVVSRWAGIQPPIDGVTTVIGDVAQIMQDALHAKSLGFGGKLCIHPSQVGTVNQVWLPTNEEIDWAHKVCDAMQAAGGNVVSVDGRMIDTPLLLKAQHILARTQRPSWRG